MNTDSQHLQQVSEEFQHMVEEFFLVQSRYSAAIKEIQTKLETSSKCVIAAIPSTTCRAG